MITNDNILLEYGSFNIRLNRLPTLQIFKPAPTQSDYAKGYIQRVFIIKHSDKTGFEISTNDVSNVDEGVYSISNVMWRISGKKDFTKVGNVVEDFGVASQNNQEIERVKLESGVSLTNLLKNPLEFWRGY
jgi:hypothetical protein